MSLDPRQVELLQALVQAEEGLRARGLPAEFMLILMPGPRVGLNPGIEREAELAPTEGDVLDLNSEGYVHLLPTTSSTVRVKFALTAAGRSAGRPRAVTADIQAPAPQSVPPAADDVLSWLDGLAETANGAAILNSGGALMNEALAEYGVEHLEVVARRIVDLRDDGLVVFDDPSAHIDQLTTAERLGNGGDYRLTAAGRDRLTRHSSSPRPQITQIIHATQSQIAAGDINNYVSFDDLLEQMAEALENLGGIDEHARDEARGILDKLRSASGTIATGTATSAGGAVVGSLFRQMLGLP